MRNKNSRQPFYYPEYIVNALHQIIALSTDDSYPLLSRDTGIINILFNQYNNFPITEQVYSLTWRWVNLMADAKKEDWLKMYWGTASQYCSFRLDHTNNKDAQFRFVEFHTMVGAMLLHKECYAALKYAFFFSNSFPARYPLIQSTFIAIFQAYQALSKKNERYMYLMRYSMSKVFEGAGDENKIEGLLLKYCALLMIRLSSVNDYNITYSDPTELPQVGNTIGENKQILRTIEVIKNRIESISNNVIERLGLDAGGKTRAIELLDSYAGKCNVTIESFKGAPQKDKNKISGIKNKLVAEAKKHPLLLPDNKIEKVDTIPYCAFQQVMLDDNQILLGYDDVFSNLEETLICDLNFQLLILYNYQFLLHSACFSSAMPYRDMAEAMKRLELDNSFAIIAIGINESFYDETDGFSRDSSGEVQYGGSKVYQISSAEPSVIIMKKSKVPTCELIKNGKGKDDDETLIDEGAGLFSNIDKIDENNRLLKVSKRCNICIPKDFRYVRFRIAYNLTSDPILLNRVKPISEYIAK